MKEVFIKYNPYKLETEFTVDGEALKQGSRIRDNIWGNTEEKDQCLRLQEWVEELPENLVYEFNDKAFNICFHGTQPDYEDLKEVFENANVQAQIEWKKAKETSDKVAQINMIAQKVQDGPIEDLNSDEIRNAIKLANSDDFEVEVVATMSAGKSTLINAMLGTKLMPSKEEACTALITKIKDVDGAASWSAKVYGEDGRVIEDIPELSLDAMNRLNSTKGIVRIDVNGDIPFVSSKETSLTLVDTPGPNNARDESHGKVQRKFLQKSSKSLVLYIMEGTFGNTDDATLLEDIAKSMKVGGKQSRDRFLFVRNKMDNRKQEDGETEDALERTRKYLSERGIENPNLFPAAALPALNIRLMEKYKDSLDEDTLDDTENTVRRLNRNETRYLEKFVKSLPASARKTIDDKLKKAIADKDDYTSALIHTGVPSIEAAVRQYVEKYAKTKKITDIYNAFKRKLEEAKYDQELKEKLVADEKKAEEIGAQLEKIQKNIDDANTARKFEDAVRNAVKKVNERACDTADDIIVDYQAMLTKKLDEFKEKEIDVTGGDLSAAEHAMSGLIKYAKELEPNFKTRLEELISDNLIDTSNALLSEYSKKLASLAQEIGGKEFAVNPLKLMSGSIAVAREHAVSADLLKNLNQNTKKVADGTIAKRVADGTVAKQVADGQVAKQVADGKEWVENTDKAWYKPWTWFDEPGYYRTKYKTVYETKYKTVYETKYKTVHETKYKTVEYVSASELAQIVIKPIQENLLENGDTAKRYARHETERIAVYFNGEFKRLDNKLKKKIKELKNYGKERDKAEDRIRETKSKLAWLAEIDSEINNILEI